jgi:hypothetical protein
MDKFRINKGESVQWTVTPLASSGVTHLFVLFEYSHQLDSGAQNFHTVSNSYTGTATDTHHNDDDYDYSVVVWQENTDRVYYNDPTIQVGAGHTLSTCLSKLKKLTEDKGHHKLTKDDKDCLELILEQFRKHPQQVAQ